MFEAPRQIRSAVVGAGNLAVGLPPYSKIDFRKLRSAIWRGRATIVGTTVATLVVAMLFTALAPHEYTAVTQIFIDPTDLRAVGNETNGSQMSDSALLQVESQVHVLTSDAVLRRVIGSEGLDHDPEFVHGPSLLGALLGSGTMPADSTVAALDELNRHVKVKRADRTYVVEVDVDSRDPFKAARIANAITEAYLVEQTEVRSDAARQVSQTLTARLKELRDRVRDAEDKVEAFKAGNNIVDANGQLVNEQQLSELNRLLEQARSRAVDAKARYEQVQHLQQSKDDTGAFPEAVQSPTVSALRTQYAEIMRREAEQMTTLGPLHPAVIDIQAQAERLRGMIAEEINRTALSARNEYESATANEQALEANLEALKRTTIDTSEAMVGLRELQRDADANRAVYEAFLGRARESSEQEQLDTKNIHVISKADLPLTRSWPPPNGIMALAALVVGIAAGTGLVLMRPPAFDSAPQERLGDAIRRMIGMATGGLWPAASEVRVLAVLPVADVSFALTAVDDPASPFAREIRKVYDEVRASHTKPANPSVLVVAADAEDDSATVAITLAALAAATQRVLLIDADLERRTLSALDAEESEAGLVDVAVGRRLLSDVVTLDRETNISLVSFVSPESRRDRRIYDADLTRAFDQTKRYDMVIVTALNHGDPSLGFFAGLVDHIVLVARAGDQGSFEQFVTRLGLDARKVRGGVLTGAAAA
jgi:polysaccharide biosynthesis transport protein